MNALRCLFREHTRNTIVEQCYVQIIMARSLSCFHLIEKDSFSSGDIIYRTVSYVAAHFKEETTLDMMARDLELCNLTIGVFRRTHYRYLPGCRIPESADV